MKNRGALKMIPMPKELIGATTFDEKGNRILKYGTTEEQKIIFEQFYNDLKSGNLTDTMIEYEEVNS